MKGKLVSEGLHCSHLRRFLFPPSDLFPTPQIINILYIIKRFLKVLYIFNNLFYIYKRFINIFYRKNDFIFFI
ncbi:hypothetical protein YC2023_033315 [Brassica napus]